MTGQRRPIGRQKYECVEAGPVAHRAPDGMRGRLPGRRRFAYASLREDEPVFAIIRRRGSFVKQKNKAASTPPGAVVRINSYNLIGGGPRSGMAYSGTCSSFVPFRYPP